MAFFGLTSLGPQEPIQDVNKSGHDYIFHTLPIDSFVEKFNAYLIGESDISVALEVDGDYHIPRAKLGDILKDLLGRQPRKFELDAWFTHLDFDRSAVMSLEEYMKGVDRLLEFSAGSPATSTFNSYDTQRTSWVHHTRAANETQQTLRAPMTTAQEVGWHALKPTPPEANKRKAQGTTDIKREGHSAQSYYGHFICNY
ncbi:hypothetical protein TSOC_009283 [Tetrabaena socialis]|uniref:EF-hand domain-containing protein n=1 Tax=Tetrabaena socialis TaxID=47790 RepID=A0A2J7ZWB8_9CHLO|nr:hypothetical protein TSOC_009283 [Tetrabaena socialis]|eukprot:PNH04548.1 hypothetical protein TSOC_009283 [Tetrabaena socialis]